MHLCSTCNVTSLCSWLKWSAYFHCTLFWCVFFFCGEVCLLLCMYALALLRFVLFTCYPFSLCLPLRRYFFFLSLECFARLCRDWSAHCSYCVIFFSIAIVAVFSSFIFFYSLLQIFCDVLIYLRQWILILLLLVNRIFEDAIMACNDTVHKTVSSYKCRPRRRVGERQNKNREKRSHNIVSILVIIKYGNLLALLSINNSY